MSDVRRSKLFTILTDFGVRTHRQARMALAARLDADGMEPGTLSDYCRDREDRLSAEGRLEQAPALIATVLDGPWQETIPEALKAREDRRQRQAEREPGKRRAARGPHDDGASIRQQNVQRIRRIAARSMGLTDAEYDAWCHRRCIADWKLRGWSDEHVMEGMKCSAEEIAEAVEEFADES